MAATALAGGDRHVHGAWVRRIGTAPGRGCQRAFRGGTAQRLGCSMVPVQFFAPQRHSQIFFRRGVWRSARVMP